MSAASVEVESIFSAALALELPAARAAYLDLACAGQADLRARIEALLLASEQASGILERPPVGLAATIATGIVDAGDAAAEGDSVSLDFLTPSDKPGCLGLLGPYEVVEFVGRGGMGIVLRAYDGKLNRIVAIKVLAPELAANPMAVKRFLREAQAVAAVSHDHVVTIHAIHDTHRPPFIVMEYVDGQSLQQKIDRQGGLRLAEVLRIGLQIAAGLAAAHKHGLVHRDIKPANILLENGVERVKITDFGLARAVDDAAITQAGQIAGTPQFMSPEQAQGRPIDPRSDLFSLGSVLYTMCTGRAPFRADTAVAALRRVCDDTPRPIGEVNAESPDWLEAIVARLLAKDPADRFQSAAEVSDLLASHLAHLQHPNTAPRPMGGESRSVQPRSAPLIGKLSGRGWWYALAVAALIGLTLLGAIGMLLRGRPGSNEVETADQQVEVQSAGRQAGGDRLIAHGAVPHEAIEIRRLTGHSKNVTGLAFLSGNRALSTSGDKSLRLWDLESGQLLRMTEDFSSGTPFCLAVSGDEKRAVTGHYDGSINFWDLSGEWTQHKIDAHRQAVVDLAFTPDSRFVVSAARDDMIVFWDVETRQQARRIGPVEGLTCIDVSPDGQWVVAGSGMWRMALFSAQTGEAVAESTNLGGVVEDVAFSPDGESVAATTGNGHVLIWRPHGTSELVRFVGQPSDAGGVAFSWDGQHIASGGAMSSDDIAIQVRETVSGRVVARVATKEHVLNEFALSPDGRRMITGGGEIYRDGQWVVDGDFDVRVWQLSVNSTTPGPE